jgi:hypothetical protein
MKIKHSFEMMAKIWSLASFIGEVIIETINEKQVEHHLRNKRDLRKKIREVFSVQDEHGEIRDWFTNFYQEYFSWTVDLSTILVPPKPEGNFRLLFVAKGLKMNQVGNVYAETIKKHNKNWGFWKWQDDLDSNTPDNIRTAEEHYAVWVFDGEEAGEFAGKSTNQADPDFTCAKGCTLLERLLHGLVFLIVKKRHLDTKGITICSGSRFSDDGVPVLYCHPGVQGVEVIWYDLDDSDVHGGIRSSLTF